AHAFGRSTAVGVDAGTHLRALLSLRIKTGIVDELPLVVVLHAIHFFNGFFLTRAAYPDNRAATENGSAAPGLARNAHPLRRPCGARSSSGQARSRDSGRGHSAGKSSARSFPRAGAENAACGLSRGRSGLP